TVNTCVLNDEDGQSLAGSTMGLIRADSTRSTIDIKPYDNSNIPMKAIHNSQDAPIISLPSGGGGDIESKEGKELTVEMSARKKRPVAVLPDFSEGYSYDIDV
ncbi:hypothetical protein ACJMK2_041988, partial [Sinanodonta woodiana]